MSIVKWIQKAGDAACKEGGALDLGGHSLAKRITKIPAIKAANVPLRSTNGRH